MKNIFIFVSIIPASVYGAIIDLSGDFTHLSETPQNARYSSLESDNDLWVWEDCPNVYSVYADPIGRPGNGLGPNYYGTITFSNEILTVITSAVDLNISDRLNIYGTTFQTEGLSRGAELSRDWFKISDDGHTLTVFFETANAVDHIRVITRMETMPAPSTLICVGLTTLLAIKRRRNVNNNRR